MVSSLSPSRPITCRWPHQLGAAGRRERQRERERAWGAADLKRGGRGGTAAAASPRETRWARAPPRPPLQEKVITQYMGSRKKTHSTKDERAGKRGGKGQPKSISMLARARRAPRANNGAGTSRTASAKDRWCARAAAGAGAKRSREEDEAPDASWVEGGGSHTCESPSPEKGVAAAAAGSTYHPKHAHHQSSSSSIIIIVSKSVRGSADRGREAVQKTLSREKGGSERASATNRNAPEPARRKGKKQRGLKKTLAKRLACSACGEAPMSISGKRGAPK